MSKLGSIFNEENPISKAFDGSLKKTFDEAIRPDARVEEANEIVEDVIQSLAFTLTHGEQGVYQKNEDYVREKINLIQSAHTKEKGELEQVIYWLAGLYQKNFNTFSPYSNPDAPEWKKEAYMHFATVQGLQMRILIKKLSEKEIDKELWQNAIKALSPTDHLPDKK